MSRKAELTVKLVDQAVSKLGRSFPEGAVKYDLVQGISKKGNFSIFSFKDSSGRLIRRESVFDKAGDVTHEWRNYYHNSAGRTIETYISENHSGYELLNEKVIRFDPTKSTKDAWMFDRNPIEGCADGHVISYLSPAKKAKKLSFITFNDGDVPKLIIEQNTGKRVLAKRNREYLPLVTSEYMGNVEQKVSHISALQEKKFHLKGVIPPAKRVPHESLQEGGAESITNGVTLGQCHPHTGHIEFSDWLHDSRDLLSTISHEYKHASDFSKINRLQSEIEGFNSIPKEQLDIISKEIDWFSDGMNFAKKSWEKGVIENNSKGGRRFTKLNEILENEAEIPYLDRLHEIRARRASAEQLQRYDSCWNSVGKLFDAKFIPPKVG